jgi:hypothetical protein
MPRPRPRISAGIGAITMDSVIVYVLTHNQANEGGTVEGVYSTEQKAREGADAARLPAGSDTIFSWEILPVEVDGRSDDLDPIQVD